MTAALGLLPLAAATSSKSSSSGSATWLILIVVGAAFYFLFYRPQQRKAKAMREQTKTFDVGDEVLTAGGLVGHVIDIDGDRITLETSVGASFVVLKQYVLRTLEAPVPIDDEPDEVEAEADEEEPEDEGSDEEVAGQEDGSDTEVDVNGTANGADDGAVDGAPGQAVTGPEQNGASSLLEGTAGTDGPTASDGGVSNARSRRAANRKQRRAAGGRAADQGGADGSPSP